MLATSMASKDELDRWAGLGGKVLEEAGTKKGTNKAAKTTSFVAPDGTRFTSWTGAKDWMDKRESVKPAVLQAVPAKKGKKQEAEQKPEEPAPKKAKKEPQPATEAKPEPEAAKQASKGKRKAKNSEPEEGEGVEDQPATAEDSDVEMADAPAAAKANQRKAAQGKSYKESKAGLKISQHETIEVKEDQTVDSEADALAETGGKASIRRRLTDFVVVDAAGQPVPLERAMLLQEPVHLSGVVHTPEGTIVKGKGCRVSKPFGPLKEWKVLYSKTGAQVVLKTAAAMYDVVKPATSYRKIYSASEELVELAHQVYLALSPEAGGSLTASLEEVVAKLARAKIGKAYGGPREFLLLSSSFVLGQLPAMAGPNATAKSADYRNTPFGQALAAEAAKGPYSTSIMQNGIKISDGNDKPGQGKEEVDALAAADAEYARRLQARMDAAEAQGAGNGRGGARRPAGGEYIRISEQEIADDYPLPKQYTKEVEETDELLLVDPEDLVMADPESLPRRLLHDFAFYNSEGFLSSLELVPMFNGVDHDVEIFGSGVVAEDEGDFTAGGVAAGAEQEAAQQQQQQGEGGSSGGSAGQAQPQQQQQQQEQEPGMRLYLSQIREWVVECACDMLFITIRTDAAWYRLVKPAAQYAPWFSTVLRAAQVAIAILRMIEDESRASRLSFSDIIAKLAKLPETSPAFTSKKADRVERFVVVHGQIVLNQFKHYPNKAVQRAAFVGELKGRMEQRKHHKLYMSKAKPGKVAAAAKTRNANPMRNRVATGLKAKPMPATATTMVKAVWRNYFFGGMAARKAAEAEAAAAAQAATAQEVEEDVNEDEGDSEGEAAGVENALAEGAKPTKKASKKSGKKGAAESAAAAPAANKEGSEGGDKDKAGTSSGAADKEEAPAAVKKDRQKPHKKTSISWVGSSLRKDSCGRTLYKAVKVAGQELRLGQVVSFMDVSEEDEDITGEEEPLRGLIACLYEDSDGDKMVQVRVLLHGSQTVLGDAASDQELFLTEDTQERPLTEVSGPCHVERLQREWVWERRPDHFKADEELRKANDARRAAGEPLHYVYRTLYRPTEGMFKAIPEDMLDVEGGEFIAAPDAPVKLGLLPGGATEGFIKDGVEYRIGDVMYLHPQTFNDEEEVQKFKKANRPKKSRSVRKARGSDDEEEEEEAEDGESSEESESGDEESGGESERKTKGGASKKAAGAAGKKGGKDSKAAATTASKSIRNTRGNPKAADEQKSDAMEVDEKGDQKEEEESEAAKGKGSKKSEKASTKKGAAGKKAAAAAADSDGKANKEGDKEEQGAGEAGAAENGGSSKSGKAKKGSAAAASKEAGKSAAKEGSAAAAKENGASAGADTSGLDPMEPETDIGRKVEVPSYVKGKSKGDSNKDLRPFALVQLVAVAGAKGVPLRVTVRRLYRPEDVSKVLAYRSGWWDVYAGPLPASGSSASSEVDVDLVVGKAAAVLKGTPGARLGDVGNELDTFCVVGTYDPSKPGEVGPLPASLDVNPGSSKAGTSKKGGSEQQDEQQQEEEEESQVAMASMDIFAGCGGLSEGMHQAGVATCRWAVEYEQAAADAFKLNNPEANVFCNNCNVLLRAAMEKAGVLDDCDACDDCMEAAAKLSPEDIARLPLPGEVEFIMGGPPCQGYSGMNRFNKGNWSMVQNSMVMAYLSYADFYRPRYFLLENVRNFVSHNKSFTFRLTLRSLLDMGYQVRFGVLNAGNYGVPQSRKRTIIWAAAPTESLPQWPKPRHVFHSPQLTINLPGGVAYTAVPDRPGRGAPLRAVTVRDAIADLPPIENGHAEEEASYTREPSSAYQRFIRGKNTVLRDHICKEMNELNLERCRCIPKKVPGADWRELRELVRREPEREKFKGQDLVPWCLPNTEERHNGWRGLFGRLNLDGHFPTSTTDPQPMGKVGQVFHPTQDRIVSVRECARSQGFPDTFRFYGNVHNKHRQVGNAVPPPLAFALGSQLRSVLEEKRRNDVSAALLDQL